MTTRLFINSYYSPSESRNSEFFNCMVRNLTNDKIDEVVEISEGWKEEDTGPGHYRKLSRLRQTDRPTFYDFTNWINALSKSGDIAIIANSDIYFDGTLELVRDMKPGDCYALSRIDVTEKGPKPFFRADSQDVWIFRTPIKLLPNLAHFTLGVPGCDNRIAAVIMESGYNITNPCKSINAFHLHNSNYRSYLMPDNRKERVSGPYLLLPPTTL